MNETVFTTGLFIASLTIMLVGFLSILFPFLPSVLVIWLGAFIYGVGTDFEVVDPSLMLIISALAFGTILLDYFSNAWGHRRFRGTVWGVLGAVVGGFVGAVFGPFGGFVLGPVFGAIVFEMIRGRDNIFGIETDHFTIVGFIGGTLVKFAVGVAMMGLFLWRLALNPSP